MTHSTPYMSVEIYNWHFYPQMINWKINNRNLILKEPALKNAINLSILIDLTTFHEGILTKVLINAIEKRQDKTDIFSTKIIKNYKERIKDLTWSKYNEYVELILGKKISEITTNENYKAVNILFDFRNLIVHANDLKIHYFRNGKKEDYYSDDSKFNKIILYFKEKKLANWNFGSFNEENNLNYLINDKIVEFLYSKSISFITEIVKSLPEIEKRDFEFHFPELFEE